jgi:hypothetical protein
MQPFPDQPAFLVNIDDVDEIFAEGDDITTTNNDFIGLITPNPAWIVRSQLDVALQAVVLSEAIAIKYENRTNTVSPHQGKIHGHGKVRREVDGQIWRDRVFQCIVVQNLALRLRSMKK